MFVELHFIQKNSNTRGLSLMSKENKNKWKEDSAPNCYRLVSMKSNYDKSLSREKRLHDEDCMSTLFNCVRPN